MSTKTTTKTQSNKKSVFLINRTPTSDPVTDGLTGGLNEANKQYLEAIDDHCQQQGDCLIWTGRCHRVNGIGYVHYQPMRTKDQIVPPPVKSVPISRIIWLVNKGSWIPEGKTIKMTCRNKLCVEIYHMRLEDQVEWDPNFQKKKLGGNNGPANNNSEPF